MRRALLRRLAGGRRPAARGRGGEVLREALPRPLAPAPPQAGRAAGAAARGRRREKAAFKGKELFDERDAAAREASEAAAKAERLAEEARRDAEGCRRAQAIAAQAPDDEAEASDEDARTVLSGVGII